MDNPSFQYIEILELITPNESSSYDKLILYFHGFPDDSTTWKELSKELHQLYPALHLGISLNSVVKEESIPLDLVLKEIKDLIASYEVKELILVAHDLGGPLVTQLACNLEFWKKTNTKLVFINSLSVEMLLHRLFKQKNFKQIKKSYYILPFLIHEATLPLLLKSKVHLENLMTKLNKTPVFLNQEKLGRLWQYRYFLKETLKSQYKGKVKSPTLFIASDKDPYLEIPQTAELKESFQDYNLVTMKGHHWLQQTNSKEVATEILNFINEC